MRIIHQKSYLVLVEDLKLAFVIVQLDLSCPIHRTKENLYKKFPVLAFSIIFKLATVAHNNKKVFFV